MRIPRNLEWWRETSAGVAWLERLPATVAELAERWRLVVGEPFEGGNVSLVIRVSRADDTPAVLKVNFPDHESRHEPDALARWNGVGAARLLERADDVSALLVELLEPGTQLWSITDEDDANQIAASVLRTLRRDVGAGDPFSPLAEEVERWAGEIPACWEGLGRPFEQSLIDEFVAACRDFVSDAPMHALLHQDFHGGNVLRSDDGWRAIDPKPLVGDPAFDAASLLRDRRWLLRESGSARRLRRRLDLLVGELGLDRERMRRWGLVHALAWGVDEKKIEPDMVECARLLAYGSLT